MDESLKHHNPNPVTKANPISKIFFWWLNPLFKKGYVRQLEVEDMYNVVQEDQSDFLGQRLETEWLKEVEKTKSTNKKPSLFKAMFRIFGLEYMLWGIILFLEEATKVIQPLLLGGLIRYFTPNSKVTEREGYLYAAGVSFCALVLAVAHHPYFFAVQRIGMKMRIACCSLLYRKSLRLSNAGLSKTTTGQIVNLMSNDVNRFDQAVIFLHFLWIGPLEAVAVLAILWRELGPSTLAGFAVLLFLVPVQGWMGKLFSKFRQKTAKHTDERVRVMNEIISGMRVIKMYCWEKPFGDLVAKIRRKEKRRIMQTKILSANVACIWVLGPRFLYFVVFLTAAYSGYSFRPESLYISLPLLFLVAQNMIGVLSLVIQFFSEAKESLKRISKFLKLDELQRDQISPEQEKVLPEDCLIEIDNITSKWDEEIEQPTLQKVSAVVSPGKLMAVIGPVGAGKSSLLMSVLKELPVSEGSVKVQGSIAYVSQQPWVFSASLRQNIVFGNKYEKAKYDRILKACALNKDVAVMPHGDLTLIGDRGVSLSGGQRARVSLARALYMNADVYLLDDPLSAVDTAVGRHIFNNVIQGLLKDKPRILVTHQLQFLKEAAEILILKDGEMIGKGTFQDLSVSGIDFASLLKRKETEEEEKIHDHSHDLHSKSRSNEHLYEHQNGHHQHGVLHKRIRLDSSTSHHSVVDKGSMMSLASIGTEFEAENVQLPEEEERRQGTVTAKIYWDYFKAGAGVIKSILLIALCLAAQGAYIASDWWLSHWSNEEENRYAAIRQDAFIRAAEGVNVSSNFTTNVTIPYVDTHYNVGIFSAIIGSVFLFGLLRALMFFKVTVDASQELHNKMFASILRSHIGFFDNNPVGRILNRFTKDIGQMDDILPICFFDFVQCSLLIVGIVIVAGVVNPWVFIPVVPLIILFVIIRRYYLRTSRHIKRLEGTTRSPVYSHLSASLQGLHTIRAFRVEEKFVDEFDAHQDLHTESWFLFLTTSRWLAIRLDWLCALFITSVSFSCVLAAGTLNAGLVGLSMSYAMTLMGMFQWGVRQSAEVENQMISVERVLDYAKLPSEAPLEVEEKKQPPPDWPQNGKIHAEGACLKYSADLPLVLKDLNFTIRAKEKVGIVGRTGAGKSSLITMLFRLVEPTGVLMIDDINIQNIGLHDLRKHISIIPQDPVLFTGALRRNLDPFHNHSDEALWRALEEVQLKPAIEDLPHGLDSEVSEGGVNFSVGQRQLICLARAILRNNRILMIDEATANVDPRTDALIQQTIREKFKQCTVLTIAHRLHTIMDSDRIMVLDEGRILEFEAPYLLLQKPASLLRKLVDQTGKSETIHLMEIAEAAYNKTDLEGESIQHMSASHHDISIVIDEREEKDINTNAEDNDFTTDTRNDFEENDAKAEVDKDSEKIEGHKGSENILEQKNSSIDKQEYSSPDIGDSIDETSEELGKDIAVENIDNADASLDTDKKSKSYESSSSSSSSESESENDNTDIKTRLISKDGQFDKENDHKESNENEAGDNDDAESAPGAVEDKEDNERREEEQESKDSDSLLKKK